MEETIKKSRLNLILISLVVSIYYTAEIKISGISFFGLKVESGSPETLIIFAWVAWAYLFLRYITYYLDEGAHCTKVAIIESIAWYEANSHIKQRALEALKRNPSWKNPQINLTGLEIEQSDNTLIEFKFKGGFSGDGFMQVGVDESLTSYSSGWSLHLKAKSIFRSLILHPEILEYWAPIAIGITPVLLIAIKLLLNNCT